MRAPRKVEFEDMSLESLEVEKQRLFDRVLRGNEPKKHRNLLYELLGVIDCKRRFELRAT